MTDRVQSTFRTLGDGVFPLAGVLAAFVALVSVI